MTSSLRADGLDAATDRTVPARRLPPGPRRLMVTMHVIVTVSTLGAVLGLLSLGVAGMHGADPKTVYPAAHLLELFLVMPLAVLALVTGVLLALGGGWGLLRHWWVTTKLVMTFALAGVSIFVLRPALAAAAHAAQADRAFTAAQRIPLVLGPSVAVLVLLLSVVLGKYKPGRRAREAGTSRRSVG